ncbi:hypothetical protein AHF37_05626, partial [Paragonimus kellicotti]
PIKRIAVLNGSSNFDFAFSYHNPVSNGRVKCVDYSAYFVAGSANGNRLFKEQFKSQWRTTKDAHFDMRYPSLPKIFLSIDKKTPLPCETKLAVKVKRALSWLRCVSDRLSIVSKENLRRQTTVGHQADKRNLPKRTRRWWTQCPHCISNVTRGREDGLTLIDGTETLVFHLLYRAGIGRSGTFVVADILRRQLENKCNAIDLPGIILQLRRCRQGMVESQVSWAC